MSRRAALAQAWRYLLEALRLPRRPRPVPRELYHIRDLILTAHDQAIRDKHSTRYLAMLGKAATFMCLRAEQGRGAQ